MANSHVEKTKQEGVSRQQATVTSKPVYEFFKRFFDVVFSFLALLVLFLPFVIISVIILIDSPGASPIFVQNRVGKNGKEFRFYKFRSMVPNAESMLEDLLADNEMDGPAFKITDDPRITRFGKFLRCSCIDELPQLLNILKGDMSFVGPRPPLPREVAMYDEYQMQRLLVTPGLTCYWQVQPQRNNISFDEWMECDIRYINERSLKTDISIFFRTFGVVLCMDGK
ncbi:MAG: sugar transferase [Clostridia bacterium]|nr:sugar transferase [Clostridia bacterium]